MSFRSQDHHTSQSATTVARRLDLELIDEAGRAIALTAGFMYDAEDPYAVTLTFYTDGPEVTWSFARDLLATGIEHPAGNGDVHVWPSVNRAGQPVTVIELQSPGGQALLQASTAEVTSFVTATQAIVASGSESDHIDLDTLVSALLAA